MRKLKSHVTGYFRRRHLRLRSITGKGLSRSDDFVELYVLACLLKYIHGAVPANLEAGKTFIVALSPSSNWSDASWFQCSGNSSTYGLRTGLEVTAFADPGTVELDVLFVNLSNPLGPDVPGSIVEAAFECKVHKRSIDQTKANEVIGKAYRVWGQLPVPLLSGPPDVQRYAVLSSSAATPKAGDALNSVAIAFEMLASASFSGRLGKVVTALGLIVRAPKSSPKSKKAATGP